MVEGWKLARHNYLNFVSGKELAGCSSFPLFPYGFVSLSASVPLLTLDGTPRAQSQVHKHRPKSQVSTKINRERGPISVERCISSYKSSVRNSRTTQEQIQPEPTNCNNPTAHPPTQSSSFPEPRHAKHKEEATRRRRGGGPPTLGVTPPPTLIRNRYCTDPATVVLP